MIRISLGNPGSGKTACEVREMILNRTRRHVYTNIDVKQKRKHSHIHLLKPEYIIKKEIKKVISSGKNKGTPIYDYTLNTDFWKSITDPINVVLDEAHTIVNARRSMSKINILVTDWLALIRRVLGQSASGYGELVLITQLPNRIDTIARDMATQIRYHICHYHKTCTRCQHTWFESSEHPEPNWTCPVCFTSSIKKHSHCIEVWHFADMTRFQMWNDYRTKTYHMHYLVNDIEQYFPFYNTLQWDNLFTHF